jgi:hypothetical protein
MKHVVERCPSCGAEHEAPGDSTCEACGTAMRHWCRVHGAEIGWLDGPACRRCAERATGPSIPCPAPALPPTVKQASPPLPVRIGIGLLSALVTGFGFWVAGMGGGALYALIRAASVEATAPAWGRVTGVVGLILGSIRALSYVIQPYLPPKK